MSKHLIGTAGAVAVALAGVWLVAAPTALSYQPSVPADAAWTDATTVSIVTGAGLLAAGLLAAFGFVAALVGDLRAVGVLPERAPARTAEEPVVTPEDADPSEDHLMELLAPLAAALSEDLRDRDRPSSANGATSAAPAARR